MGKSIGHAHPFSLAMLNCQRVYHNISRLFALFSVASPCNPVGSLTDWLAPRARELYRSEVARVFVTKWSISLTWRRPRTRAERRLSTFCVSAHSVLWFDYSLMKGFFVRCVCVCKPSLHRARYEYARGWRGHMRLHPTKLLIRISPAPFFLHSGSWTGDSTFSSPIFCVSACH